MRQTVLDFIEESLTGCPEPSDIEKLKAMETALKQMARACNRAAVAASERRATYGDPNATEHFDLVQSADQSMDDAHSTITEWDLPL